MDTVNLLGTQFTLSAIIVYLLQRVKQSKAMPWINVETGKLNRITSIALAGLSALGINLAYSFDSVTGTFVLTIHGLVLANILHFGWTWLQNFVMQHTIFKAVISKPAALGQQVSAAAAGK